MRDLTIHRVLNNNAIVELVDEQEVIHFGSGLAFQKKKGQTINRENVEKTFVLKNENKKYQELLKTISNEHMELGERIISYAEQELSQKLDDHLHVSLIDHISFSIKRASEQIVIKNKLLNEIKLLYKQEFQIGLKALEMIMVETGIQLPEDEAAHIALHIHSAKGEKPTIQTNAKKAIIIKDMIDMIASELNIRIEPDNMAYQRILTHLDFALSRFFDEQSFHTLDPDMISIIKDKYDNEFGCSQRVVSFVEDEYNIQLPESEVAYIALHIERLRAKK